MILWGGEIPALKHNFAAGHTGSDLLGVTQGNKTPPPNTSLSRALHFQELGIMLLKNNASKGTFPNLQVLDSANVILVTS